MVVPEREAAPMIKFAVAVTAKYAVRVTSFVLPFPLKMIASSDSCCEYHIALYQLICSSIGRFPILSPLGYGSFASRKCDNSPAIKYIPARVLAILEVSIFSREIC